MKRYQTLWLALASASALGAAGCGDDSRTCGTGTMDKDGVCVADGTAVTCTGGTELNAAGTGCIPSDSVCAEGTVLVGDHCEEETPGMADATEGAEPNGLGVLGTSGEASDNGAGALTLKAVDQTLIVKGTINPFRDANGDGANDPDFDTFTLHVDAPAMLDISADGTHGLAAAFLVATPVDTDPADPLVGFQRYGVSPNTDTSKRFVYLPAAGDYTLTVGDIRAFYSLDPAYNPPPIAGIGGVAGGPKADYYLSITAKAIPAATPIILSGTPPTGMVTGPLAPLDMPKLYTVVEGEGLNQAQLTIDGIQTAALVVTTAANTVRAAALSSGSDPAATTLLAGATDTIVADAVWNYGPETPDFTLTVSAGTAAALSTTGGTATQPEDPNGFVSVFYFDVAAADEIDAFSLHWNQPVVGLIVDKDQFIAANFTFDGGFVGTFQDYKGLIRFPAPGRYYFFVGDPDGTGPTSIVGTSTIAVAPEVAVTKGTPLANAPLNVAARAAAFSYAPDIATDAWQLFNATGMGTGEITLGFYDPADAYGTLSPLTAVDGDVGAAAEPSFSLDFPAAGLPTGHVLQDDVALQRYLVSASTATATGTPTLSLDFKRRDYTDFGVIANGMTSTKSGTINNTTPSGLFLAHTNTGNTITTITVHPTTITLNPVLTQLDADETPTNTINNGIVNVDETMQVLATGVGWVAFSVSNAGVIAGNSTFDVTVAPALFTPGTYTVAAGATTYSDACVGAGSTTLNSGNGDEYVTGGVAAPAGFKMFGFAAPTFRISTNGYLAFNGDSNAHFTNLDIPVADATNGVVAPYWDDLENVEICAKTTGTKKIVQWTGDLYVTGDAVSFQAILDGSTNTIEFVYDVMEATGESATIGIEDQAGSTANKLGRNTAGIITANASKQFTPVP